MTFERNYSEIFKPSKRNVSLSYLYDKLSDVLTTERLEDFKRNLNYCFKRNLITDFSYNYNEEYNNVSVKFNCLIKPIKPHQLGFNVTKRKKKAANHICNSILFMIHLDKHYSRVYVKLDNHKRIFNNQFIRFMNGEENSFINEFIDYLTDMMYIDILAKGLAKYSITNRNGHNYCTLHDGSYGVRLC